MVWLLTTLPAVCMLLQFKLVYNTGMHAFLKGCSAWTLGVALD